MLPGLAITDRAQRRKIQRRRVRAQFRQCAQHAHFVEETCVEHRVETALDARVQDRAILRRHREFQHPARKCPRCRSRLALPVADRPAAEPIHLQRTLDPLRIGGVDARGGDGIDLREFGVHRRPAAFAGFRFELRARRGIGLGHRRQPLQQGAEIQAGAAGEDRQATARDDVFDCDARIVGEIGGRIALPGVAHIDQMMRHRCELIGGGFRCTDVEPPIHQRRIDADDLAIATLRPIQRKRGLARSGRTHQGDGERAGVGGHEKSKTPVGGASAPSTLAAITQTAMTAAASTMASITAAPIIEAVEIGAEATPTKLNSHAPSASPSRPCAGTALRRTAPCRCGSPAGSRCMRRSRPAPFRRVGCRAGRPRSPSRESR